MLIMASDINRFCGIVFLSKDLVLFNVEKQRPLSTLVIHQNNFTKAFIQVSNALWKPHNSSYSLNFSKKKNSFHAKR